MTIWSGCSRSSSVDCQVWTLERRALDEGDQPRQAVDGDERIVVVVLGIEEGQDLLAVALPGMLLEEALALGSARAAQQRHRPVDHERRHPRPDLGIVVGQPLLGDADVGPVDAIGMGELHLRPRLRLGLDGTALADDLARRLVVAQAAEGGMAQDARRRSRRGTRPRRRASGFDPDARPRTASVPRLLGEGLRSCARAASAARPAPRRPRG